MLRKWHRTRRNRSPKSASSGGTATGQRFGMVIGLKPEMAERYRELHANPWESVLAQIDRSNIRDYSIFLAELTPGRLYLFSFFRYVGKNFKEDMALMAQDAETQRWWRETEPCQIPLPGRAAGEQWARMEEVFHWSGPGQ